jgi:hypothetical protein
MAPLLLAMAVVPAQAASETLRPAPTRPAAVRDESRAARPGLRWRNFWALIAVPSAIVAALVWKYGVDGPHYDQWTAIAPLIEKHHAGTLGVADFFALHNEHRIAVPRLLAYALARLTHWDTRAEMLCTLLLCAGVAANGWQLLRVTRWRSAAETHALFAFMALLLFSTLPHENFLWGFQLSFLLPIFFCTAICWIAVAWRAPWNFAATMLLASAATFSLASGFVCWLLAMPLLAGSTPSRRWWIAYALLFVAEAAFYLVGYTSPEGVPGIAASWSRPSLAVEFFCAYLGAPFAHGVAFDAAAVAPWIGGALLAACGAAVCGVWRERHDAVFLRRTLPWLAIAAFGLANAAMTSAGRASFGVGQALESRYATYALLVPVALAPLAALLLPRCGLGRASSTATLAALGAMLALSHGLGQVARLPEWAAHRRALLLAKALVQTMRWLDEPQLLSSNVTPGVRTIRRSVRALDAHGWLRPGVLASPSVVEIAATGETRCGALEALRREGGGDFIAVGWATLPARREAAHAVLLTYDDAQRGPVMFALAPVGVPRADIAAATGEPADVESGWAVRFPRTKLPPGPRALRAWAYDAERQQAWRLAGETALAH